MIEDQLLKRIRAVNIGHLKSVELISVQPHADNRLGIALRWAGHCHAGDVRQFFITKPMTKALINGSKNKNLDNALRLKSVFQPR